MFKKINKIGKKDNVGILIKYISLFKQEFSKKKIILKIYLIKRNQKHASFFSFEKSI